MNSFDYSSKEIRLPHRRIGFHLSVSFLSWPAVLVGKNRGTCFEWNLQYWQPLRLRSKWKTSDALGRWMFGIASTHHHAISRQYCDASDFPWLPVSPLNLTERVVTADADLVKGRFVWQDFVLARDCVHHVHDLRLSHRSVNKPLSDDPRWWWYITRMIGLVILPVLNQKCELISCINTNA